MKFRFSLAVLTLCTLLLASLISLWMVWTPWRLEFSREFPLLVGAPHDPYDNIGFSSDDQSIELAESDMAGSRLNKHTGETLETQEQAPNCRLVSRTETHVAIGLGEIFAVYSTDQHRQILQKEYKSWIEKLAFSPSNKQLCMILYPDEFFVWDATAWEVVFQYKSKSKCLDFAFDGDNVLILCEDGTIMELNLLTRVAVKLELPEHGFPLSLSVASKSRKLAVGYRNGNVEIFALADCAFLHRIVQTKRPKKAVAFSNDEQDLVILGEDGEVASFHRTRDEGWAGLFLLPQLWICAGTSSALCILLFRKLKVPKA